MTEPLVSVIIPFYNRVNVTLRALESAINQTYKNIEIILINDGSTESWIEIENVVKNNSNCKIIHSTNKGPASARNIGIKDSKGEYIAFLDSDDCWKLNKLEIQIGLMIKNDWLFSHTSFEIHNIENGSKSIAKSGKNNYTSPWPAFHCKIATPTVVINSGLNPELSFNESLRVGEDTLLWYELSRITTLHGINIPLTTVHVNFNTTARNKKLKIIAFESINRLGFPNSPFFRLIHNNYVFLRKVIYKFY